MSNCKYYKRQKQVRYYNSSTQQWGAWQNTSEYSVGELVEYDSPSCSNTTQPLTFTAIQNGTFSFSRSGLSYSLDDGTTWAMLGASAQTPTVQAGRTIIFKGDLSTSNYGVGTFSATGNFDVSGNIFSIVSSSAYQQMTATTTSYQFYYLFRGCTKLVNAKDLVLPALTLTEGCYSNMFNGCSGLRTAPQLPATVLAANCYQGLFYDCVSLQSVPQNYLPVTTLETSCYGGMFKGCTSLQTAPDLPATTLAEFCYFTMFSGCTALNYVKCLATDISAEWCTNYWFLGVYNTGVFVKAASMNDWTVGDSGIPSGWSVVNES